MHFLRKLLFPIVPIYYAITWIRNRFYDKGWFASKSYDFPVICVGNLSVGGTGKTPMIEYLIGLLKTTHKVATLSRGYKRATSGFYIADAQATAASIGDEPFQFYSKFKDITVAVDADRQHGITELKSRVHPDVILLDDAFQHRKVKAGFNIMLSTFDNLYIDDIVLPTGDLREPRRGANRADVIVVTKCPDTLSKGVKEDIERRLKLQDNQQLFFSHIAYSETLYSDAETLALSEVSAPFTLVTGIANPSPLVAYLEIQQMQFEHLNFKDHHEFSSKELHQLNQKSLIITTEKDYMRLQGNIQAPMFYLPIEVVIDHPEKFNKLITDFVART